MQSFEIPAKNLFKMKRIASDLKINFTFSFVSNNYVKILCSFPEAKDLKNEYVFYKRVDSYIK